VWQKSEMVLKGAVSVLMGAAIFPRQEADDNDEGTDGLLFAH
jgi:hypothetical protein